MPHVLSANLRALFMIAAASLLDAAFADPAFPDSPRRNAVRHSAGSTIPDDSWNSVFDRRDGWTGADCAGTVNLGDGRMLWLFGDTWISSIRGGKRQPGAAMVNNSIAVHSIDRIAGSRVPDPKSVHFYWGAKNADGRPTAWVAPAGEASGKQLSAESREWYWPTGGGIVIAGPAASRRLFLFFFRVRTNPRGKGVWTFTVVGTTLAVIDDAAEPVDRWHVRLFDIPHSLRPKTRIDTPADAEMTWGMSACFDPESEHSSHSALIYGIRKTGSLNDALVLARAPIAAIDQFDRWQFYDGKKSWASSATASTPLVDGLVSEFSVERLKINGRTVWTLVQSEPFLGKRIFLRTAPMPQGPWSQRRTVASVPDIDRNRSYFTYAAKGHAELSRPGELLITYLVNSNQFSDLIEDTQIYRPKFLRLPASFLSSK